jgi:flagellar biosynthesis protein FliQ
MHGPINVKTPNNTSKWQMGFNSAFKGLTNKLLLLRLQRCAPAQLNDGQWCGVYCSNVLSILHTAHRLLLLPSVLTQLLLASFNAVFFFQPQNETLWFVARIVYMCIIQLIIRSVRFMYLIFNNLFPVSNNIQCSGIWKTSLLNVNGGIVLVYARSHK